MDVERLSADIFAFISYDPIGVEGGQGSESSGDGGGDEVEERLELSVPKIEYINTVAEALLLVEYLRVSWIPFFSSHFNADDSFFTATMDAVSGALCRSTEMDQLLSAHGILLFEREPICEAAAQGWS